MSQGERWIIFYTDGSTFAHVDGKPWDAPRRSVQSIASVKDCGTDWYNINMSDYFYWEWETKDGLPVGGWQCADRFAVYDHLLRAKYPCVLFGRMLSDAGWKELHTAVVQYCDRHRLFILGKTDERPPKMYR